MTSTPPVFVEGTSGVELIEEMRPRREDLVVSKTRYSAFVGTVLDHELRSRDIDTVVVAGLMTNYCSVTTARHAHDLDYKVVSSPTPMPARTCPTSALAPCPHADMLRAVTTSLAGGVAEATVTADVVARLNRR